VEISFHVSRERLADMTGISSGTAVAGQGHSESRVGTPSFAASQQIYLVLIALVAFSLYWLSSFALEARDGITHFGSDTFFYAELAKGHVFERLAAVYEIDRIFRFHPTTVVMAAGWMKLVEPLTPWITPLHLLRAMSAVVGAVGVWAAMWAFAAAVPRRYVALWGAIYGASLAVWYFSSIEESKIVSATLATLYIATYLHLRQRWTMRGAAFLTAILLLACLNETVAVFLLIIPIVDTLVQRGWDLRHGRWIVLHGLAGPTAVAMLEGIMRFRTGAAGFYPESASHFSMLVYYISQNLAENEYSPAALYAFALKWLFFNIAAPTPFATFGAVASVKYGGDFEPVLANYLSSPVSAGLAVLLAVILVASVLPRYRAERSAAAASILLALLAYAVIRGVFFGILNPGECLLFSTSATLAHMLMMGMPFSTSTFPAKGLLLAVFAGLLFLANGAFIVGRTILSWP
jgi:hypothetical protein